jgi:DNA-binding MarR family transcriptional regulator
MDAFEKSLNHVLVEVFNLILKYEERMLRKALKVPLTITETHTIEAIGRRKDKETTVSDIASLLSVSMPTATVAIKKLESKGFIKKDSCEKDGRRTIISLTGLGRRIEKAHHLFHESMVRNISNQFIETEKVVLLQTINKLNDFFKEKIEAQV